MPQFIYGGETRLHAFRGQPVTFESGQIVELTDAEAESVMQNDPVHWRPLPTRGMLELKVATDVTLTAGDNGKRVIVNGEGPVTVTLPASPAFGYSVMICHGGLSQDAIEVDPGALTINSAAGTMLLPVADDSLHLLWTNATWRTL